MLHSRCCLADHPGICSSITNATHLSTVPTPPTLANKPCYPRWRTTHVNHAGTSATLVLIAHHFPNLSLENSGILLKGTTTNISRQEEGILNILRPSMSAALPPVKSVLTPLAKSVLLP